MRARGECGFFCFEHDIVPFRFEEIGFCVPCLFDAEFSSNLVFFWSLDLIYQAGGFNDFRLLYDRNLGRI